MTLRRSSRQARPRTVALRHRPQVEPLESRDAPAVLSGTVWQDINGDGVRQSGEPGLAGRAVFLDTNGNGSWDTGEPTQTTASDGRYSFTGLAAGTYAVVESGATGWVATNPRPGPLAPGSLAGAEWRHLGPLGGDVVATAVAPGNSSLVLAALDSETTTGHGGLFRSLDGGQTWAELPFFRDDPVSIVTYAPNGTAYAGTFNGLWRSTDDGLTWSQIEVNGENRLVYALGFHPTDPNTFLVGLNPGSVNGTVFKTTDGGATWTGVTPAGASDRAPRAIAFDPANPNNVYLGFAGSLAPGGLFTSSNGGNSWVARSAGLSTPPIWGFAFDGTGVLAVGGLAFGSQVVGLYRSTDHGATWTSLAGSWPERYARSVAVDPANPSRILVGTERQGVYRSTDGGATWTFGSAGTEGTNVNSLRLLNGQWLAGTSAFGVLRSSDGGVTFTPSSTGIAQFEAKSVAVNPTNSQELIIAYNRLNTGGVLRSTDGGTTWARENVPATRYQRALYSPTGEAYVVSDGSTSGSEGLYRRNADGTWTSIGPSFVPNSYDVDVRAIQFDPANPDVIVVGGQMSGFVPVAEERLRAAIWRSTDRGATWQRVYVGTAWGSAVVDVELLPVVGGPVLLATVYDSANQVPVNGDVLRSADGGLTWASSRAGLPTNYQGAGLARSAQNSSKVYLANGYVYQSSQLYVSTDAGLSWTATVNGGNGINELLVDPVDDRIIYANGAGGKVTRSQDGGVTFTPFDAGLDNAPWFYGWFALNRVDAPAPRLVAATLAGVFSTELYSTRRASQEVTLTADETRSSVDFGSHALPGEISGSVWEDEDGNGVWGGEFGRSGWKVYLDIDNDGRLDPGEPFTISLAGGPYRFTGVPAGTYTLRLQPQFGFTQTFPVSNGGYSVSVSPGGAISGKDFGIQLIPIELRGRKWNDADGDGVFDTGESPLAGWTVFVDYDADGTHDWNRGEPSAVTDADGNYVLRVREPGVYLVTEIAPPYWEQTSPGDGRSRYDSGLGFEPAFGSWADRDPATPDVIDLWYDYRSYNGYANEITEAQKAVAEAGMRAWEQATGGKIRFSQNTTAGLSDIIVIGTGDMAALGDVSQPRGTLGRGGNVGSGIGGLSHGIAWMDRAEDWDTTVGNGNQGFTVDYFSVATHEIGHALGLHHASPNLPWTWLVVMGPAYTTEYPALSWPDKSAIRGLYGATDRGVGFHVVKVSRAEVRTGIDFGSKQLPIPFSDLFLDFGTPTSPVEPGYVRATGTTTYSPTQGYGWSSGSVTSVDRGSGSNLTRDFVATNDATFVVDMPNGSYEVTVTLGDASSKRDQMTVWLEGSQVANVSTNSGQFKTLTFTVTVTDNQLTVRFLDIGGRTPQLALNALKVVKVMPGLSVSISPTTISEGAGATAATGTVTRGGDLSQSLTVTLTSSDTTEATVPATVTIPAGQASATFTISAINDTIIDGTQIVTVTARAANYRDGSALLSVTDDDRKQFSSAKFDFGTAASPVAGGFTQVTPTTSFSETTGYGWLAGSIGATDRSSGTEVNRDFNSTGNGTFVVNVPNGTYSVTITLGDAAAAHDRMAINLEGARVDNNISTAAGQFSRRTYSVTVSDGQLTLQLQDQGGKDGLAVINALELTQTGGTGLAWGGTAGEIARLLEATTERDRRWFRRAGG